MEDIAGRRRRNCRNWLLRVSFCSARVAMSVSCSGFGQFALVDACLMSLA